MGPDLSYWSSRFTQHLAAPALESPPSTLIWPTQHLLETIMRHNDPANDTGRLHARQSDRECDGGRYFFFGTRTLIGEDHLMDFSELSMQKSNKYSEYDLLLNTVRSSFRASEHSIISH